ncbi:MAG: uroporphyrinogen-III C-methyltransferase [Xenococcaceae cyanobacterium]
MSERIGKVYLVGAGVGSVAYLTLRGKQLLSQAEVLVYDALVDPQLLELVPPNCLKLDVGKRGGCPSTPQEKINQLLVAYCLQGKQVVRLKSGDPLIFGRSIAEMQALRDAGCDFELIPGISSALAAPLLAGIPLTDKVFSSCFAVMSAHKPEALDWEALARIDTLVILMGGSSLSKIVQQLQDKGRSPSEPVAIIRNCGRREQQVWIGTLADIVDQTAGISLSPAVIVIGKVVRLRRMYQSKIPLLPLTGKTVLVTRAAEQSSKFTNLLQQQGATVIEMPALLICPPSSWEGLDRAIANLSDFHWLILTSANGVEYFFNRLATLGKDARALAGIKIAVVGKKTAAILKQHNLQPDFIPPDFVADSLVENFPESLTDKKVLFPRVETGGREVLVKELTAQGVEVVEVAAYQSRCPTQISPPAWEALQQGTVDLVTFASSKTVKNFYQLIESALTPNSESTPQSLLENVCIASIGPQTSKSCHQILGRVDIEAQEYTLEGLTEALVQWSNQFS